MAGVEKTGWMLAAVGALGLDLTLGPGLAVWLLTAVGEVYAALLSPQFWGEYGRAAVTVSAVLLWVGLLLWGAGRWIAEDDARREAERRRYPVRSEVRYGDVYFD